jgi:hypothetical protein
VKERLGARTRVSVEVEEQRGEIGIHRAVSLLAAPGALHFSRDLHTATVRPPAPFAGHGSFDGDARGAGQWTGNLTVDLPGRSDVPVTGPGFAASLEHPSSQRPPSGILERVAQRAPRLGHSQLASWLAAPLRSRRSHPRTYSYRSLFGT